MKDKEFDAVRMMREIRDELSRRYNEDPSAEGRDGDTEEMWDEGGGWWMGFGWMGGVSILEIIRVRPKD